MAHNAKYGWSGPRVMAIRKALTVAIEGRYREGNPYLCRFCGGPVTPEDTWDIDHALSLDEGGAVWDLKNMSPAHSSCNRADGARISMQKQGRMRKWD